MINTTSLKTSAGETLVKFRKAGAALLIVSATVGGANVRDILTDADIDAIEIAMTNAPATISPVQPAPVQPDYAVAAAGHKSPNSLSVDAENIVANARAFCAEAAEVIEENYKRACPAMVEGGVMESARIEFGRKYAKIIRTTVRDGKASSNSVFAFIDLATGDILKAASWAKPARGARGNVLDIAGRRNSYTPYGINRR